MTSSAKTRVYHSVDLASLWPTQGLNDLLRHLMLHQVHRKRVSERLGRHRPDGKRHAVTRRGRNRLAYPAARRVLAPDVPQPAARGRLRGRKLLPQSLNEPRIGKRHRP